MKKPDACDDLEMTLLATHRDFRFCVEWLEQLFCAGLLPTAVGSEDRKLKLAGLSGTAFQVIAHALIYHARQLDGSSAYWMDVAPGESEKLIKHLDR